MEKLLTTVRRVMRKSRNKKLGANVYTWSILPGIFCPGASELCLIVCYAFRMLKSHHGKSIRLGWTRNSEEIELPRIPKMRDPSQQIARIHVAGDFHTERYILSWIAHAQKYPHIRFWAYTRSWVVPELVSALQTLHDQPNFQLFASKDETMSGTPPTGWRVAYMGAANTAPAGTVQCMEQTELKKDCRTCGFCWRATRGSFRLAIH
jgi:hypothetical protein